MLNQSTNIFQSMPKGIASGVVHIYKIINGQKRLTLTSSNAIVPNYKYLLSRLLIEDGTANLSAIRIYDGATLLNLGAVNVKAYIDPNIAEFQVTFDEASFNSNFDKLTLGPTDGEMGIFSELTGLDESKDDTESLLISWQIKFN